MPIAFQFEERSHTYRVSGVVIPGVTRVIDHAGITSYDNVRQDILERRSQLGKHVHRCVHFLNQGDLNWETVDARARGYVESWAILCADLRFTPRLVEYQCVAEIDGMPYGMQIDCEGIVGIDDAIIDVKITRQAQEYHGVQLAGYALGLPHDKLASPIARFAKRKRFVAKLDEVGKKARLIPYESKRDADVFRAALVVSHYKLNIGQKIQSLEEAA